MTENMLCHKDAALSSLIEVINSNGKGTAFIVDDMNRLCGVITDGDVRRFLLKGHGLVEKVHKLINDDYIYAKAGERIDQIFSKLNHQIKIIPIVDEDRRVVDFIEDRSEIYIPIAEPDLKGNELKYLMDAFLSTRISNSGEYVEKFEQNFSRFCQCEHGVSVANGTVAIHLALLALGIREGDEVIVPDLTFAATINAVLHARAVPVIADIEEDSWCIDPAEAEKAITPRTKAILPVHLYGQPCDMASIMEIARAHKLFVVEDCAEAHGARYRGRRVGSFGDIGCFSFYGNKIITTGEGGMCVSNSSKLAANMRLLRDHGMSRNKKYWHDIVGYNYRLTNLQSAIGFAQLERIDEILLARRSVEERYKKYLSDVSCISFQRNDLPGREKITWLVSILVKNGKRDEYIEKLKEKKIDARPFFYPLSDMDIYRKYVFSNRVSRIISKCGLNFPTKSGLGEKVLSDIREVFAEGGSF